MGEFRLPIGAQIFIAEAAGQLKVAFHAADHEQLFEELRRLGQGVETLRMDAAGHQVIASPFGSADRQHGSFDFQKTPRVEKLADALKDAVPGRQIVTHGRPADVQVPVLEPQFLGHIVRAGGGRARDEGLVGNGERQRVRFGEHRQFGDQDFKAACFEVGVLRAREPLSDFAPDRDAVFGPQGGGRLADFGGRGYRAENDLHDAAAVAQVDKQQPAVIPEGIHPAGQQHLAADILRGQLPAKDPLGKPHEKKPFYSDD